MFSWSRDYLDFILVPSGLSLMFGYHLFLLYRYLKCPQTTVIGYEIHNKRAWVARMLQLDIKDRGSGVSVISSHITAATAMSSICLVVASIIGAWVGSATTNIFTGGYIYGNRSPSMVYTKYISLLSCFLVAFACFFQTAMHFVHANFLISMPNNIVNNNEMKPPVVDVEEEVMKGSYFWLIGLRSLYFAAIFLLWVFGPIPMFVCSAFMVTGLFNLDRNTIPLCNYT